MELKLKQNFKYRVKENENLNDICHNFNTSKENIVRNNPDIDLFAGEYIEITVNNYVTHIVKPIETLTTIAKNYNQTVEEIMKYNNLSDNNLFIGQRLKIKNKDEK